MKSLDIYKSTIELLVMLLKIVFYFEKQTYSRLKLSKRACKSASASDGVTAPPPPPPVTPPLPPAAPTTAACGCLLPAAIDNDPEA